MSEPTDARRRDGPADSDEVATDGGVRATRAPSKSPSDGVYVPKVYAYVTRDRDELLVFEGPEHDGLQVPKGTVEPGELLGDALGREVREESGLGVAGAETHLCTDVWTRRRAPPRRYVRHFYHVSVDESRDRWTHTVTGDGAEVGLEYEFSWVDLPPAREFAMAMDDYVPALEERL